MAEPTPAASARPAAGGTAKGEATQATPSRVQTLVARRMAESRATVPDFTLTVEVDMEAAVALRPAVAGEEPGGHALEALVVRAAAAALRAHPRANGSYRDARFESYARVNVGVTVLADGALVVPTVFDADQKDADVIEAELAGLSARVRAGATTQPELSGGTFTVSNLGTRGVRRFAAVIIPPQAGILAVGELAPRAVVRDGTVVARHCLDLTLSADHRVLYGAEAAAFLQRIRLELESPAGLLA